MTKFEEQATAKGLVPRDLKNASIANLWALLWMITLGATVFLSEYQWYSAIWVQSLGLIIHIGMGIGMVLAFKRFIAEADELDRKIQLDALALSVGMTVITFSSYSVLQKFAAIPHLTPAFLIVIISLTYSVGIIVGKRRFR
jgi:hypothetical protein